MGNHPTKPPDADTSAERPSDTSIGSVRKRIRDLQELAAVCRRAGRGDLSSVARDVTALIEALVAERDGLRVKVGQERDRWSTLSAAVEVALDEDDLNKPKVRRWLETALAGTAPGGAS